MLSANRGSGQSMRCSTQNVDFRGSTLCMRRYENKENVDTLRKYRNKETVDVHGGHCSVAGSQFQNTTA